MRFYGVTARLHFIVECGNGEERSYIDVVMGYELHEKLGLYFKGDYTAVFEEGYDTINVTFNAYVSIKSEM